MPPMPTSYVVVAQLSQRGFRATPIGTPPPAVVLHREPTGAGRLVAAGIAGGDNTHSVEVKIDISGPTPRDVIAAGPAGGAYRRAIFAEGSGNTRANAYVPLDITFSDGFEVRIKDNGSGTSVSEYWLVYEMI
jgi:hypothetical protein